MLSRPVAAFIAFVLFWAAFATHGQVANAPQATVATMDASHDLVALERDVGSIEERGAPDDSSAVSQLEGGGDLPEGVAPLAELSLPAPAAERPRPFAAASRQGPVLDGLRRPPRAGLSAA
jgi:hypothetical protein